MTDAADIRCEDIPGRRTHCLIVCGLPDNVQAVLGVGSIEDTPALLPAYRRKLEIEARRTAAAFVAGWNSTKVATYLAGFKAYDLDAEDRAIFDREVAASLSERLRDDDAFRVSAALTVDIGVSADRRIIDLIEPLLDEVNENRRNPKVISAAAKFIEMNALRSSPMLRAIAKDRDAVAGPRP